MQIHEIKPRHKFFKRKRIGRGGKRGTYSGKGMKGQKSRSGTSTIFRAEKGRGSWVKRLPKLGGFNSVYVKNAIVNSIELNNVFKAGDEITPQSLIEAKLINKLVRGKSGKLQRVKLLYNGEVTKKLIIKDCLVAKKVKTSIEKAGGKIVEANKAK